MTTIDFCGTVTVLDPRQPFRFGRAGDLVIDDNPHLHRQLGCVEFRNDFWWLRNTGRRMVLVVRDLTSRTQVQLAPGREMALTFPAVSVEFSAGRFNYEFEIDLETQSRADEPVTADGEATITLADLPLTDDQRRLILALAERTLRSGGVDIDLPTNREAAHRLDWGITRYNRKLDNVCGRLSGIGVPGLRGKLGEMAVDRRERLVEHAVSSGLVKVEDLVVLDSD